MQVNHVQVSRNVFQSFNGRMALTDAGWRETTFVFLAFKLLVLSSTSKLSDDLQ